MRPIVSSSSAGVAGWIRALAVASPRARSTAPVPETRSLSSVCASFPQIAGAGDFDLRAGRLLQARGQTDAAAGQDHSDVAAADPDILYGEPPALFEETAIQPPGDFIRLKHRL